MLYIGVDLGTSAVKLLMMDASGDVKKVVSREYPLFFPQPGWSEQRPEDWFTQAMDGLKELTAECDRSQVAGISFGGQMHGLVVLEADDQVIRPAILWNDGRTGEEKLPQLAAMVNLKTNGIPKLWSKLPFINQSWRCTFQQPLGVQLGHRDVLCFLFRVVHI